MVNVGTFVVNDQTKDTNIDLMLLMNGRYHRVDQLKGEYMPKLFGVFQFWLTCLPSLDYDAPVDPLKNSNKMNP